MTNSPIRKVLARILLAAAIVCTTLGVGYYWGAKKQPQTIYKDRIVERTTYLTKAVTKDVERRVVKPDGTTITTVTHLDDKTQTHTTVSDKTTIRPTLAKYSLGVSVGRVADKAFLTQPNLYSLELGRRIMDTPLWITTNLSSDRTILLGLRLDF